MAEFNMNVTADLDNLFGNIEKQVKFATAVALTNTAKIVKEKMPEAIEGALDRPTSFTKKGLYVTSAKTDTQVARVGFMDIQAGYMRYQVAGGERTPRAHGIKLPANVTLNSFGNIPRGLIAQLRAAASSGMLSKAIKRKTGVSKGSTVELFLGKPEGRTNAPNGIWKRENGRLTPIIIFSDKPARYRPRFMFELEAQKIVQEVFADELNKSIDRALATMR